MSVNISATIAISIFKSVIVLGISPSMNPWEVLDWLAGEFS